MSYGSQQDVLNYEAAKKAADRELILGLAAEQLVYSQRMGKRLSDREALMRAERHVQLENDVDDDETGVARAQGTGTFPELVGLEPASGQIAAIKKRLRGIY